MGKSVGKCVRGVCMYIGKGTHDSSDFIKGLLDNELKRYQNNY